MSSILEAIARLMAADSVEETETILAEEPELLSLEADEELAKQQALAREQGDRATVDSLAELRELLQELRQAADFPLPEIAGSNVAADLIFALIVASPAAPVPAAALAEPFFAVLDAMRDHAAKNGLKPMVADLKGLDRRARNAGGRPKQVDPSKLSLLAMLEEWIEAPSWAESRTLLAAHPELSTPDAVTILTLLAQGAKKQDDPEATEILEEHLSILAGAREGNLDEVYAELIAGEEADEEE